ncbi:hypothetical protein J8I29_12705 [Labrys sp. LIt4]|uniref:Gluconate 2-dehydrogenase subunit 3 family protein n=1 Tax=Labrys okinawensis TaxID=346911 RepID=A0A2S9QDG0_9HYPH|nr:MULTISPECIES: hypothetical protein [Labrys]MBP0580175.1 hypothetical protein [Labrys sp. LIt4]PRH87388.1 hypothetical protein C5L14_12250 [Labrys okinawensis]
MRLMTLAVLAATLLGALPSQAANDTNKNAPGSSPPVSTQTPTVTVTTPANDDSAGAQATPQVFYGDADLPAPVRELRQKLLAAIKTGELESLRPIFAANGGNPDLPGGESDDPIATLKLLAGDPKGREILAIMEDVLEAGYVHVDAGTPQEAYVWPYFARYPLNKLTGPQMVELFRLITAGDFQDMQDKGVYSFYRLGISPQGKWQFFEDGD